MLFTTTGSWPKGYSLLTSALDLTSSNQELQSVEEDVKWYDKDAISQIQNVGNSTK